MDVGQTAGNIGGGIAGAALLGALDGPLPFMDMVGGGIGSAIGGDIGKAIGGKGKKQRMAGEALQYSPLAMAGLMEGMPMVNPNTQMMAGMGIVDPNPSKVLQEYAMY
jgi:phage tail tape-measure protein